MMTRPIVSIITPSYNQARFVEKTIRSVLNQDYPNIEYLVVDGGSTDGSVEIIRKYADKIDWWVSEKDRGQADGINKGLRRASGEIVAWLNSDDFYLPGAVTEAVQALQENPQSGLVYGNLQVVNENGETTNILKYADWQLQGLMEFKIIGQPAVFMRRAVMAKAGYLDETYHYLLDHHLWLRMAARAGMKYVPRIWAGEHYHPESKNLLHAAEFGVEAQRIVEWISVEPTLKERYERNKRRIEAGAERLNAFYLFDARQYRACLQAYGRSLNSHPAAAAKDWYRILFALLSPLGLEKLKSGYLARRKTKYKTDQPDEVPHA